MKIKYIYFKQSTVNQFYVHNIKLPLLNGSMNRMKRTLKVKRQSHVSFLRIVLGSSLRVADRYHVGSIATRVFYRSMNVTNVQ